MQSKSLVQHEKSLFVLAPILKKAIFSQVSQAHLETDLCSSVSQRASARPGCWLPQLDTGAVIIIIPELGISSGQVRGILGGSHGHRGRPPRPAHGGGQLQSREVFISLYAWSPSGNVWSAERGYGLVTPPIEAGVGWQR